MKNYTCDKCGDKCDSGREIEFAFGMNEGEKFENESYDVCVKCYGEVEALFEKK